MEKSKTKWKNVSDEIYALNGYLAKVRNTASKIANDKAVFPKTRDNAKMLLSMLAHLHDNFWGPLTWYK